MSHYHVYRLQACIKCIRNGVTVFSSMGECMCSELEKGNEVNLTMRYDIQILTHLVLYSTPLGKVILNNCSLVYLCAFVGLYPAVI